MEGMGPALTRSSSWLRSSSWQLKERAFIISQVRALQLCPPPFLEALREKGLEGLCMCDPIEEYAVQQLKDDGEQYEYGDVETHAIDADTSDFSPHQFIAPDKACDAMGSDDNEQDAANNDAARSKILSVTLAL